MEYEKKENIDYAHGEVHPVGSIDQGEWNKKLDGNFIDLRRVGLIKSIKYEVLVEYYANSQQSVEENK